MSDVEDTSLYRSRFHDFGGLALGDLPQLHTYAPFMHCAIDSLGQHAVALFANSLSSVLVKLGVTRQAGRDSR